MQKRRDEIKCKIVRSAQRDDIITIKSLNRMLDTRILQHTKLCHMAAVLKAVKNVKKNF